MSLGAYFTIGVKADRTCVKIGSFVNIELDISNWKDVIQVSYSDNIAVGLKSNGTCVATGSNTDGQIDKIKSWTNIVQIACGRKHVVGLKKDGTVVAVGDNSYGQCDEIKSWTNIIQVSCGFKRIMGVISNGGVVATEGDYNSIVAILSTWEDIIQVDGGHGFVIGLKKDGTCVGAKPSDSNNYGQCNVSDWKDIVQISCGGYHTIGLKSNGTCIAVGENAYGQCNISDWKGIIQVTCGWHYTIGLKSDGTCVAVGNNSYGQCDVTDWKNIVLLMSNCHFKRKIPKYLLKQNNQYYAIKSQFYDVNMCQYRPCEKNYETNGIDDLNDLTKNIDYIEIEKDKENVNDVDIFEFDLNNKIMNFDEEFERKIILKSNQIYSSTGIYANSNYYLYEHLINDTFDAGTPNYWLGKSKNGYLLISLENESYVEILKIYPYCRSDTYSHYSIAISSDNVNFEKVTEFTSEKKNEREFNIHYINKSIKYIKISFKTTGTWGDCLNEIQVYRPLVYCLLKKDNQYYTLNNGNLKLLENQNLNKNNFETNGFDDLELLTDKLKFLITYGIKDTIGDRNIFRFKLDNNMLDMEAF